MNSLWEAIILVVIVAIVGFWDWRAALLMAASIPLSLAMAFGVAHVIHIEIQQVSIATLIRPKSKIQLGSRRKWGSSGKLVRPWNVIENVPRDVLLSREEKARNCCG